MNPKQKQQDSAAVLVVCNETASAPVWGYMIREQKLSAIVETSPARAVKQCEAHSPALTVIDLQLPFSKIMELAVQLRMVCENPIVVFLQAYDEKQIIDLYKAGIDDCVIKPVSPAVFFYKVRAWLRHSKNCPNTALTPLQAGGVVLDPAQHTLIKPDGKHIKLTNLELRFLHLMMSRADTVVDTEEIINKVWGLYDDQDTSLVKHLVYRLRQKIEDDPDRPQWLVNRHGEGYSFSSEPDA